MTALRLGHESVGARCSLLVALTAPVLYLLLRQAASTGPTYLSDEITYLAYAAHFSGRAIDAASSHHSGYGLFLAPAFVLFDLPQDIWRAVLVINATLWAATLLALRALLRSAAPQIGEWQRLLGLLAAALYPSMAIMAGYAFPTPAFSLVFVLSAWALLLHLRQHMSLGWHLACLALLYWIHPTAIGVIGASVIALAWTGYLARQVRPAVFAAACGATITLVHDRLLHPMIVQSMTPVGSASDTSYPPGQSVLIAMADLELWLQFGTRLMGQVSYTLIGSFGLVAICVWHAGKRVLPGREHDRGGPEGMTDCSLSGVLVFLAGSLVLIAAISAFFFAYAGVSRLDHWVYGRYVDGVVLPMIAIGSVLGRSTRASLLACAWILSTGALLQPLAPDFGPHNLINTVSLWPHYLAAKADILTWFGIGAAAVGVLTFLPRPVTVVALAVALGFALLAQNRWQAGILATHSAPSDIVDIVRANYAPGTCVGFDYTTVGDALTLRREKYRLYTFQFLSYRYARMSALQWQESCDGPLLTFQAPQQGEANHASWRAVAREKASGLLLLTRASDDPLAIPGHTHSSRTTEVLGRFGQDCLIAGCFSMDSFALAAFAQVGVRQAGALTTDFRSGYLFHGPYLPLEAGEYELTFDLDARLAEGAIVDVVSARGAETHYRAPLCPESCPHAQPVRHIVSLPESVMDVEVRVLVSDRTDLSVRGYVMRLPPSQRALGTDARMGES